MINRKFSIFALICCATVLFAGCDKNEEGGGGGGGEEKKSFTPVVGEVMPAWQSGCFDIHFINTPGCGECTYLIYPDGTQMLIDAAGTIKATGAISTSVANNGIRERWEPEGIKGLTEDNITFNCGKWIADYIKHCQEWTGRSDIDYVMATHFHTDHIGAINSKTGTSTKSGARLTSMVYLLENFKVGKIVDRDYPNYSYPMASAMTGKPVTNWKKEINYQKSLVTVEKFDVGSTSQFAPKVDASKYAAFKALSLSANGAIWTGSEVKETFPSSFTADNCPEENHCSATMKFTYGAFDYYASADMQYDGCSTNPWLNISTNVAQYCGEVDVMKAEHHGCSNTNGTGLYSPTTAKSIAYLKPRCWIVCGWDDGHPRETTFERLQELRGNQTDIYIANSCSDMRTNYLNYSGRVKGDDGHVVVRVYDNGNKYYVFLVEEFDSSDSKQLTPTYKVKTVNSYTSK